MVDHLTAWIEETAGISPGMQVKLLTTLAVILGIWLLRRLVLLAVRQRHLDDPSVLYRWRKTSAYVGFLIVGLSLFRIWFVGFATLGTFLGLVSAGMAIALKDLLVNLAGWLFILWRRPFEVGDRIQIGAVAGDVIDVRIFQFTLLEVGNWVDAEQSTGRVIHVPNARVFTDPQANYDKGFRYIWNEIPVLITFESNWKKAKQILREISDEHAASLSSTAQQRLRDASRKFMIQYTHLTPTVYTSVRDHGVLLTIRYLCQPRGRRGTEQEIWEAILERFAASTDIDFAYPTTRFYDNRTEGKPDLVPEPTP